jgi:outer membrane protein assembly factor BamB
VIASDFREAQALDRFWDDLARADPDVRSDIKPNSGLTETVHRLYAGDVAPRPDSQFMTRLREDLMQRAFQGRVPLPFPPGSPAGIGTASGRTGGRVRSIAPGRPAWRWLTQDAFTVPLVLLLALGFFAQRGNFAGLFDFRQDTPGETAMLQGNAARTGEMPGPLPAGQPGLLWRLNIAYATISPSSAPVVADGVVYFSGIVRQAASVVGAPALFAVDLATGDILWQKEVIGLGEPGSPVVVDGAVFIGTSGSGELATPAAGTSEASIPGTGDLVAFDAATGTERWRTSIGSAGFFSPAVADGVVYVGSDDGKLHAIDANTGQERWSFAIPVADEVLFTSSPAVADGLVYITGTRGNLYAIDVATGAERWRALVGGVSPTTPVVAGGTVYVGADQATDNDQIGGMGTRGDAHESPGAYLLYAFGATDGTPRWMVDLGPAVRGLEPSPAVVEGTILVAGLGNGWREVRALDVADGAERWRFTAHDTINAAPVVAGETVVVGGFDGSIYALDFDTGGLVWEVETGGSVSTPAYVAGGAIVVASTDGNLYAIGGTGAGIGTPIATPVPDNDLSGLGACDVTPLPTVVPERPAEGSFATPAADADVTPVASLVPVTRAQRYGDVPGVTWDEVPTGAPASAEAVAGINATIERMVACARPGREAYLAALYTDDFHRRPWVRWYTHYNGYFLWAPSSVVGTDMTLEGMTALPDGRVAAVFSYQGTDAKYGYLAVFAEQDGQWLVDELIEISPFGDGIG